MKHQVITAMLQANRPDLANLVAYGNALQRRKGSERDNADYPPDLVFDHDLDGSVELYWYGKDAEAAGLYVNVDDGRWEWWWHDIDARKAEKVANQVADLLTQYYDGTVDQSELPREAKRLGAR